MSKSLEPAVICPVACSWPLTSI